MSRFIPVPFESTTSTLKSEGCWSSRFRMSGLLVLSSVYEIALAWAAMVGLCLACRPVQAQINQFGISRIVPGWTNYSTGFSMTHDVETSGEFATVASFYTPAVDARPREFGAIIIWVGQDGATPDFSAFSYQVMLWSGLEAFIQDSRRGDLASFNFSQPTGGSTVVRDSTTRGGRPAYHVRFALPGPSLTLTQCHTYLVGICAIAASAQAGEIFVPTAPFEGDSDVQGGDIVPFGWTYVLNSGGSTIYYGQLATELRVESLGFPPRLQIVQSLTGPVVSWPDAASCYTLEMSDDLVSSAWRPAHDSPELAPALPPGSPRFFRLIRENPSRFVR